MKDNFQASLEAVLKDEGGNDDDPADHGGRTSRGITQREYDAWRKEHGQPTMDVWKAPKLDIDDIYLEEYWRPQCDLLPKPIDYLYFDLAVNAGPYRAAVILQRSLGVTADGRIGSITRAAIAHIDPMTFISTFSFEKRNFYIGLHQPKFTRGWLNRVDHTKQVAISMMKGVA